MSLLIKWPALSSDTGTHVTKQLLVPAQVREGKEIIQAIAAVSEGLKDIEFASLCLLALLFHRAEAKQPARLLSSLDNDRMALSSTKRSCHSHNHTLLISQQVIKHILLRNICTPLVCYRSFHTSGKD